MGIDLRVSKLVEAAADPARKKEIAQAAERLVSLTGMGSEYKVMGIVPAMPDSNETAEVYPFS